MEAGSIKNYRNFPCQFLSASLDIAPFKKVFFVSLKCGGVMVGGILLLVSSPARFIFRNML